MNRFLGKTFVTPAVVALALVVARPGDACSICRCGDATFNALGKDGFAAEGFRAAFDWERFAKEEGNPAEDSESQVENRFTALASYGFSEKLTLFVRVPWSVRDLTETASGTDPELIHTSGLSDPEVYGQVRLWASEFAAGVGRRSSLSLGGGVKLPWGENDVEQDGERVDEHAQPGTGSTDGFGGLAFLYLFDRSSSLFASSGYRYTGRNKYGYRYGSTFLASAAYEHKLGKVLDGVVGLDFRNARKDQVDAEGDVDDDTGGSLLYLTPRLLASLGHGFVLRAAVQIPIARSLNGFQEEHPVYNVGLSYVLPR
jgi:hypothetical protein